jgi:hypothetical protein
MEKARKFLVPSLILLLVAVYSVLAVLSEGTIGGGDDLTHFRYARYAFAHPYLFLHHWGKPVFTALSAPFAQFGWNGIKIFNVLAGAAAAWFTYATARLLKKDFPVLGIFLVISSPLYTMLMLSGMTEVLFSLFLVVSIFLFFRKNYVWSALLLSFLPFVRNEGVVILPLFALAYAWEKQWKALPCLLAGFVFYSLVGTFHYGDLLWVIHEMPYTGGARDMYGSGPLLHYVYASKFTLGIGLALLAALGGTVWVTEPFTGAVRERKPWLMEMLVAYLPFAVYLAAHSFVWWKGMGNSVGLIRVIAAVVPSAALLGVLGWSRLMAWLPVKRGYKQAATGLLCLFLAIQPHLVYEIPVPLIGTQKYVREASEWLLGSEYFRNKIYYYDPHFEHFLGLDPYDEARCRSFLHNSSQPETGVPGGAIVLWDAHFSPGNGQLPLERLMDHPGFRLIRVFRPDPPFLMRDGQEYKICVFQRIMEDDGVDNRELYTRLLEENAE